MCMLLIQCGGWEKENDSAKRRIVAARGSSVAHNAHNANAWDSNEEPCLRHTFIFVLYFCSSWIINPIIYFEVGKMYIAHLDNKQNTTMYDVPFSLCLLPTYCVLHAEQKKKSNLKF